MAKDKVGREEKKLPASEKEVKADSPKKAKEEKVVSRKWHAEGPSKKKCICMSAFQDKNYGHGLRLHTRFKNGHRCTVCGSEKLS